MSLRRQRGAGPLQPPEPQSSSQAGKAPSLRKEDQFTPQSSLEQVKFKLSRLQRSKPIH